MQSDEDLMQEYLLGDESAFEVLVARHVKGVYSFAALFTGNTSEAEDITQDVFLKAWKYARSYVRTQASFKTWLMRIARNTAIDYMRKRKHVPFSQFDEDDGKNPFDAIPDDAPLPEELLSIAFDAAEVREALKQLAPHYRDVLLLYYGSDLSLESLATALGESVNTIKSRHRRGLAALRVLMHPKHS